MKNRRDGKIHMQLAQEILEAVMVVFFGISWPFSIWKSYHAKTAKGKSLPFLLFIFFGYVAGIVWKLLAFSETGELKWPTYFYFLNLVMVGTEIVLYFRNRRFDLEKDKK